MPTFDIPKQYKDGDDLYESHLDAAFEYIEDALNTTKLDSTNIQAGGIATSSLANLVVEEAKIALGACTTSKLADGAVTGSKLNSSIVDGSTLEINSNVVRVKDAGIVAAKLAPGAVGTSVLADGAVTQAKRAALGQQISASCGQFNLPGSYADVPNLSVSLPTTGRLVFIGMIGSGPETTVLPGADVAVRFVRDGSVIATHALYGTSGSGQYSFPLFCVDAPAAGAHTYKIQARAGIVSTLFEYKLVAFEL